MFLIKNLWPFFLNFFPKQLHIIYKVAVFKKNTLIDKILSLLHHASVKWEIVQQNIFWYLKKFIFFFNSLELSHFKFK